jgi:hypothetical protein
MDADLQSLCALLREAIAATRMTTREAEEALGMAHGSLEGVLKGKLELRVRHILSLAAILRVSPADFFTLGCPTANDAAQNELLEWLSPPWRRALKAAAPAAKSSDLADLVRATIREELAQARLGVNGPEGAKS